MRYTTAKTRHEYTEMYGIQPHEKPIQYSVFLEHKLLEVNEELMIANEDESPKKYGIFQYVSNWLSVILISSIVGSIVGSIIGFILASC